MLLQRKITITIFIISACCFFMTVALISIQANELLQERSIKQVEEITARQAQAISFDLEKNLSIMKTITTSFETFKENQNGQMNLRTIFISLLQRIMIENPNIYGIGTIWESNALDGLDKNYINEPNHDFTGRFIPYIHRKNNYIQIETVNDYDSSDINNYYNILKHNQTNTLIKPYYYNIDHDPVLMTSLLTPIFIKNKFSGALGIDINIQELQSKINKIKTYKNAQAYLIHRDGTFISHPDNKKIMSNIQQDHVLNQIFKINSNDHHLIQIRQKDEFMQYVSCLIYSDTIKSDWILVIAFPLNEILADNNMLYKLSVLIAISSTIFITVILLFLLRQFIYRPLFQFTKHIQHVTKQGDFLEEFSYSGTSDEFSNAIHAFNQFTLNLNQFINECSFVMNKVSQGDLTHQIKISAKGDLLTLKKCINESIFNIKSVCLNLNNISENLNAGTFKPTQDFNYLSGDFKILVDSLNESMTNIDEAISLIRELINALSHQNYIQSIDKKFVGDLECLRVQLNQVMNNLNKTCKDCSKITLLKTLNK